MVGSGDVGQSRGGSRGDDVVGVGRGDVMFHCSVSGPVPCELCVNPCISPLDASPLAPGLPFPTVTWCIIDIRFSLNLSSVFEIRVGQAEASEGACDAFPHLSLGSSRITIAI